MTRCIAWGQLLVLVAALPVAAQEHRVAKIDTAPPADAIAPTVASQIAATGFKVTKGSAVLLEMWPAKEWPLAEGAAAGGEVLYPLSPGQLIGVARYPNKASDFREQDIPAGTYIVRYGQQPVDGAHVGTSPTRDFLLLLPAAKDREAAPLDSKTLIETSKETTGTAHPAILSLQAAAADGEPLSIRDDSERQLVIVRFVGKVRQGQATKDLPVELVVVGKATE
jgi:hypothetical protein